MKGVILAGGFGGRLRPLTLVTNKHLLPVYDRPMIHYAIECLVTAGLRDVLLVTGGEHGGDFLRLLGNGRHLGLDGLHYTYQRGEGGIADALLLAEDFAAGERICVVLGDNIVEKDLRGPVGEFLTQPSGAKVLLKEVPDPERFGVVRWENGRIAEILEKPAEPPSRWAVTGISMYDRDVFDICRTLEPSARGELEITDVNNAYLRRGDLTAGVLDGWWIDAGTFDSLYRAGRLVAESGANRVAPRPTEARLALAA